MFDAVKYAERHAPAAACFAVLATSEHPEKVRGVIAGWLSMVNEAVMGKREDMFEHVLSEAVKARQPGMTAVLVSSRMSAGLVSGRERHIAVCKSSDLVDGVMPAPVPGMRLFYFSVLGPEANCILVPAITREEWDKVEAKAAIARARRVYRNRLTDHVAQLVASCYAILTERAGHEPDKNLEELLDQLRMHIHQIPGNPESRDDAFDTGNGLDGAASQVLKISLALGLNPSKLFAEAEQRIGQFAS